MRVNPNLTSTMLYVLNQSAGAQTTALEQLSTGRRVNRASDDPAAEAQEILQNSRAAADDQYIKSSDTLKSTLASADSVLSTVVTALQRAITLGVEGATGTLSDSNRTSIANELQGIKSQLLSAGNTTYAGQYLFAGTATQAPPYAVDPDDSSNILYNGNSETNTVDISSGIQVTANMPGSSIFSKPGSGVFDAVQGLINALKSGDSDAIGTATTQVRVAFNTVSQARVFYGNTVNQIDASQSFLQQDKTNIASLQENLVGADMAETISDVTQAEVARNATLAAAARMSSSSLLDYLK